MPQRYKPFGTGLILLAVLLFLWALLFDYPYESLLVFGVILLLPIGVYLSTEAGAPISREDLLEIRRTGPGQTDPDRERWIKAQIQRARSIRFTLFTVLFSSLALYLCVHVDGAIKFREGKPPTLGTLAWKTHADRLSTMDEETKEGDRLALIALENNLTVEELARANPTALVTIPTLLESVVEPGRKLDPMSCITLEAASRKLKITPEDVALEFPKAQLVKGQKLRLPIRSTADPLQWYDWMLWALVGIAASLLIEVGRHTRLIFHGEGDFLGETPWYWAQLVNGPLIAFVLLLFFTSIDIDLLTTEDTSTFELNLNRYPIDLLIVPAFLLGFYSRVARELLDQIMRGIFGAAWRAANGDFKIKIRGQNDREIESQVVFEADPSIAVVWSVTEGTINSGGVFNPPAVTNTPKKVFVTAVPASGTGRAATEEFLVVKHRFNIKKPQGDTLIPGRPLNLTICPSPTDQMAAQDVHWRVVEGPALFKDASSTASGLEVEINATDAAASGDVVEVEATYAGLSKKAKLRVGERQTPAAPGGVPATGGGPAPAGGASPGGGIPPAGASKPALAIRATLDGNSLANGANVSSGSEIMLEAIGLAEEQAKAIDWTANPVGSLTFDPAKGAKTSATVGGQVGKVEIVAKHSDASPGNFNLEVKAG